jgi:hypothetical protein
MIPLDWDGHRRERLMMGRREGGQGQFFYSFDRTPLGKHIRVLQQIPPKSGHPSFDQMELFDIHR